MDPGGCLLKKLAFSGIKVALSPLGVIPEGTWLGKRRHG